MWLISLLFLPLSSALFAIPYGIQYKSVTEDDLDAAECWPCYVATYQQQTSSENIWSCGGPVLFVGAQKYSMWWWWESTIYLGAFGLASELQQYTALNHPHESNGVYWYNTPGKSFGFLADMDLQQEPAADTGTTNPDSRLSWHLDSDYGGYRAGSYTNVLTDWDEMRVFRKLIYNCPNNFEGQRR